MRFFLLAFFIFLMVLPQKIEKIEWQNSNQLNWQDFKGKPKLNSNFKANTNSGISYGYKLSGNPVNPIFNYSVVANFYPKLSWVNPKSKSKYLLKHEQLHFDISELYARKLRKSLSNLSFETLKKNPKKVLNALYVKIENQRVKTEINCDAETQHSLNKPIEKKWEDSIHGELQKLEKYRFTD